MQEGPDRGRAWLIAFAACIINMILSGISRMIGILYVAVIDEYGVSRQEATIPFSIRNSIRCLAGPIVGVVGQIVGIKTITFCGGVIAALGACLCSIAPNITWLTILWGGVHGSGFAFANTLFQVIVNQYFEKYRATASGLALSGACVGSLAFPFLFEAIINAYRLSGAFLILGGVVMHVLPMSLLLCSPPWLKDKSVLKKNSTASTVPVSPDANQPQQEMADVGGGPPTAVQVEQEQDEDMEFQKRNVLRSTSFSDYPEDCLQVLSAEKRATPEHSSIRSKKSFRSSQQDLQHHHHANGTCPSVKCVGYVIKEEDSPPTRTEGGSSFSTIATDNQSWANISSNNSVDTFQNKTPDVSATGEPQTIKQEQEESNKKDSKKSLARTVLGIILMYKNPVYVLICVSMSTYVIIFIPILTVIVDYGKDKGITGAQGKYLINALAVGDLFGRLCFGWVTDKKFMTIYKFMALCQVMQGGVVAMFPLSHSLFTFMLLLGIYGMMAGIVLVHFPILVLNYVPADEQAVGMGSVGFLSGVVTFGIPPLIGHFRDKIGSYDGMFFFIGAVSLVSGAVWLLEPVMVRKLRKKEAKRIARTS